jgi:hypothetical protein
MSDGFRVKLDQGCTYRFVTFFMDFLRAAVVATQTTRSTTMFMMYMIIMMGSY